jgi:hypothetical protein
LLILILLPVFPLLLPLLLIRLVLHILLVLPLLLLLLLLRQHRLAGELVDFGDDLFHILPPRSSQSADRDVSTLDVTGLGQVDRDATLQGESIFAEFDVECLLLVAFGRLDFPVALLLLLLLLLVSLGAAVEGHACQ